MLSVTCLSRCTNGQTYGPIEPNLDFALGSELKQQQNYQTISRLNDRTEIQTKILSYSKDETLRDICYFLIGDLLWALSRFCQWISRERLEKNKEGENHW